MVKIECILCGGTLKIPILSDTGKYEGASVCKKCGSLIRIKLVNGKVQKYDIKENKSKQKDRQYNINMQGSDDDKRNLESLLNGERPKQIEQEPEEREGNTQ